VDQKLSKFDDLAGDRHGAGAGAYVAHGLLLGAIKVYPRKNCKW